MGGFFFLLGVSFFKKKEREKKEKEKPGNYT